MWLGKKNRVEVAPSEDLYLTIPKRKKKIIKAIIEHDSPIVAPIKKGQKIGDLHIYVSDELIKKYDVLSGEELIQLQNRKGHRFRPAIAFSIEGQSEFLYVSRGLQTRFLSI